MNKTSLEPLFQAYYKISLNKEPQNITTSLEKCKLPSTMKMFKQVENSLTVVLLKMPEATTVKPYQFESLQMRPRMGKNSWKEKELWETKECREWEKYSAQVNITSLGF